MKAVCVLAAVVALTAPASASAELAIGSRSAGDGWIVTASVHARGLGPVDVAVGSLQPAPRSNSHPWLQHEIVFTNTGNRVVTFGDSRTVRFLPPNRRPALIVADQGCGYALRPLTGACLLYLDILTLEPLGRGKSEARTITLWKGLRGMKPLVPGTYVFRKVMRFGLGRDVPRKYVERKAIVVITYRVEAGA